MIYFISMISYVSCFGKIGTPAEPTNPGSPDHPESRVSIHTSFKDLCDSGMVGSGFGRFNPFRAKQTSEPGFFDLEHGGKVIRKASSNGYRAEGFDEEDAGRAV